MRKAGSSLKYKKPCDNEQNTAGAKITTQLQKRFLLVFWTDVDGGYWVDESSQSSYTAVHTLAVQTGTYRVKVEYESHSFVTYLSNIKCKNCGYITSGPGAIVKPFSSESGIDSTDYVCYYVDEDKKH